MPSKEVDSYAVETLKKMVQRPGHRKIIMRSDSEAAILALTEATRRETDRERDEEIALEGTCRRSSSNWVG